MNPNPTLLFHPSVLPLQCVPTQQKQLIYLSSLIPKSMKNYSFSNITSEQTYSVRKSNDLSNLYRHSQLKSSDSNLKIEEIKKKYDTPSRRERIESLKKSKEYELGLRGQKQQSNGSGGNVSSSYLGRQNSNHLKESFAVNRMEKSTLGRPDFDNKEFMNLRPQRQHRRPTDKQNQVFKSRQSEEAMFSKVREIKQSIINNNYMKSSNGRSSIASGKYPVFDCKDGRKQFQPRVENIDKINSKIKQILNCLSENQRNSNKYAKDGAACAQREDSGVAREPFFGVREISQSKKSYQSHFQKNSDVVEKINISEPSPPQEPAPQQPNKSFINQQFATLSRIDQPNNNNNNNSKSTIEYIPRFKSREYSVNRVEPVVPRYSQKEEEIVRTPNNYQEDCNELKASRSKSQIDSIRKSSLGNENGSVLKSGKKVNDQISKIQKKIEEFQKEKRKLNIEFTPFSMKNKSTANLNASLNSDKPSEPVGPGIKNIQESRDSLKNILEQRSSSHDLKFKSYMNRASNYEQKYSNLNSSKDILSKEVSKSTSIYENVRPKGSKDGDFELKIQQIEVKTVRVDKEAEDTEEENIKQLQQSQQQAALKKRTDEGIEERRKRWKGEEPIITTEVVKNIVRLFCEQVKLDENLRNLKIWLESVFESNKFSKLIQLLQRQGIKLDLKPCQQLFTVDQSQNNPFFSVQSFQGNYELLTSAYLTAEKHWSTKIQNKFDRPSLSSEGFTSQKIDLQRKGFIQLQDLVRFLNIQSGTFFRNRDLFLIFRRLTATDRLNFDSLLHQLCG